jgi:multisubunit Na+/H+ antiporter MnhB subunit
LTIVSFALLLISFSIKKTNPFREIKSRFSVALVSGLFALLFSTSYVSTQSVTLYDTGGYQFGMVKWLSHC